ncbi:vWA domain-containing protein, partial [Escherichia coli]
GAGGETPGENAIRVAYNLAKRYKVPHGNNRVILATDGDFNVGQSDDKELEQLISTYRELGIYLTCLGVGMGNYKDSKLEALAKKGNGNFSYIDQIQEAEKVLVKEFTQTLFAVANEA